MKKIELIERSHVFTENDHPFKSCHCSSLVKNENGDILVTYFAGEHEGSMDQGIWLSRKISGVWQAPKRIKYMHGFIHWNPLLHYEDGVTYLFYKVGMTVAGWYTMFSVSYDFGETWSESRELVEDDHTPRGSSKNKVVVRDDGVWLGPCSVEKIRDWDSYIDISRDKGKTWEIKPITIEHRDNEIAEKVEWDEIENLWISDAQTILRWDGIIQPSIWKSGEGQYHALMRSTRGCVYRTDSTDNGETWSAAYQTDLPNNNSGIDLVGLPDGAVVLVYNPISADWGSRSPLTVAVSTDNGKTWIKALDLETEKGEFSYPAIIYEGGLLEITYTWRRTSIVHCTLKVTDC